MVCLSYRIVAGRGIFLFSIDLPHLLLKNNPTKNTYGRGIYLALTTRRDFLPVFGVQVLSFSILEFFFPISWGKGLNCEGW